MVAQVRYMKTRKALIAIKLLARLATIKFVDKKKGGGRREESIPDPVDTSHVTLSESIHALTELLAETSHDDWCNSKRQQGWVQGAVRDNEKKVHPELVHFGELPEGSKEYNREPVKPYNCAFPTVNATYN